jgi:hypothetical protein
MTATNGPFRFEAPSTEQIAAFHEDGYIAFPDVLRDEALSGLLDEILAHETVADFLAKPEMERGEDRGLGVRNWDNKKDWSDQLFDAPLVCALLQALKSDGFHFCHSTIGLTLRGAPRLRFHQDHHHWNHENQINIKERQRWYIQMLYYPVGFDRGDAELYVIPGSHRVAPLPQVTGESLLVGEHDEEAKRQLKVCALELPPGSMVFLNARCFHGVSPKPAASPQEYRILFNYVFKEIGPPHRYTQPIPPRWLDGASPYRRSLFDREAYSPDIWPQTR